MLFLSRLFQPSAKVDEPARVCLDESERWNALMQEAHELTQLLWFTAPRRWPADVRGRVRRVLAQLDAAGGAP